MEQYKRGHKHLLSEDVEIQFVTKKRTKLIFKEPLFFIYIDGDFSRLSQFEPKYIVNSIPLFQLECAGSINIEEVIEMIELLKLCIEVCKNNTIKKTKIGRS